MRLSIILIICLTLFLSHTNGQDTSKTIKLAVSDFFIKKGHEDISKAFTDRLEIELLKNKNIRVITRSKLIKILAEQQLQISGITEENLIETGKILGIEYIITGTIAYREFKLYDMYVPKITSINSKLINIETSEIVGFATIDSYYYATATAKCAIEIARQYSKLFGE